MLVSYANTQMSWLTKDLQMAFIALNKESDEFKKASLYEQIEKFIRKNKALYNENSNSREV